MEFTFDAQVSHDIMAGAGYGILRVTDRLLDEIRRQLQKQVGSLPAKQVVLDAAAKAYDRYIAPLDIPGVPVLVEPWVDNMLKSIFLRLVAAAYDQLQAL